MHVAEGILSGPVLLSAATAAAIGTGVGLKKMDVERIARTGMLAAAFFVTSLIHVPIGPSNIHLILNGIVGLLLGWTAFPAILIALVLQALFFQYGGISTLGVNTLIMALPAVTCGILLGRFTMSPSVWGFVAAFLTGALAVLLAGLLTAVALIFTEAGFWAAATLVLTAHIPVMVIEGIITAFAVSFLRKVAPEMLHR